MKIILPCNKCVHNNVCILKENLYSLGIEPTIIKDCNFTLSCATYMDIQKLTKNGLYGRMLNDENKT